MRFERRTGSFTASWSGFAAKRETEIELQTGGSVRCGDVNYTACYVAFFNSKIVHTDKKDDIIPISFPIIVSNLLFV